MKITILFVLLFLCFGQKANENFQRRGLYYDDYDHACRGGLPIRKDLLVINLYYDGLNRRGFLADAGTYCNDLTHKAWRRVAPAIDWSFFIEEGGHGKNVTMINFAQEIEAKRSPFSRKVKYIGVKTSVINPAILNDVDY